MAKYEIPESSQLGQLLLELSGRAGGLIEYSTYNRGEHLTKTEIVEEINEVIRLGKKIRNLMTHPYNKGFMDSYKVGGEE